MSIKLNGGILGTGKLTERSGPDKITDTELVRCWDSDTNFHRRERAIELADAKGSRRDDCTGVQSSTP